MAATDLHGLDLRRNRSGKEPSRGRFDNRSHRRERTFVKLNCAAIPTGLLESELFDMKEARSPARLPPRSAGLSWADRGTIFLDEVGKFRWNYKSSCSECSKSRSSNAWAAPGRFMSMSASLPRPTVISVGWWRNRSFAATCITGSRSFRSPPLPCASAPEDHSLAGPTLCSRNSPNE